MKTFKSSSEENLSKTLDINVGDGKKIDHFSSADTDYMILDDINDGDAEIIDHAFPEFTDYMMLDDMTLSDMILDDMKLDEMINNKAVNPLRAAIGLDKKSCSVAKNQKATRPGLKGLGGCPPSLKNTKFADSKIRSCKPSNRKVAICREVRQPLTSIPKGPKTIEKKTTRVVQPPPDMPKITTGISKAALNYNATDRIRNLAKPRSFPKTETIDKQMRLTVKPQALAYKPSLRIQQLALPRIRIAAKNSSSLKDNVI